ncbi:hypothetical protein ACFR97_14400 [Haloplanus litoreus]|uniref:Restriction endonuclease n=1 Tax=Haloplanus litoreus TaxID=767515 RepID=A0ABD5ZYJ5_9EURY
MVSYGQKSDRESLRRNFNNAVDLIGRDWLEQKKAENYGENERDHKHGRSPHPLVIRYHRGRIDLFDEEVDAPELYSEDHYSAGTHSLVVLGEHLSHLSDSHLVNQHGELISTDISDHLRTRLQNPDEFREVIAEIEAAALYSREGYGVDFIEEGKTKAPDLRIRNHTSLCVECKRCSRVTQEDRKHGGLHEAIQKSINSHSERDGIFIVNINRTPSGEEAHNIDKYLPEDTEDTTYHRIDLPFGELLILPFERQSEIKTIERQPTSPGDTPYEFYSDYVAPVISSRLNMNLELDDFRSKNFEVSLKDTGDTLYLENSSFIGILHESNEDRVKQILRQFSKASGKFPESTPNILHLKIPFLTELTYSEFDTLVNGIGGKLNISDSISAVVISWHRLKTDPDGSITYETIVGNMENITPRVEIPSRFELPGPHIQEFASMLEFQD